jgi:DNA-binding MarR family transcriptional regulator
MQTTSTVNRVVLSNDSGTGEQFQVSVINRNRRKPRANKAIENAVYAHLQALRALGRITLNTVEVAAALSLAVADVNKAVASLSKKGVKPANV